MTTLAYFEGKIVPIERAKIRITNNTLHYGTGCFADIRAYWNENQENFIFSGVMAIKDQSPKN